MAAPIQESTSCSFEWPVADRCPGDANDEWETHFCYVDSDEHKLYANTPAKAMHRCLCGEEHAP